MMHRTGLSLRLLSWSRFSAVRTNGSLFFRKPAIPRVSTFLPHRSLATSSSPKSKSVSRAPTNAGSASVISSDPTPGPSPSEPMPRSARYLGLAGTLPFFSCAGVAVFAPELSTIAATTVQMYGASILSFLGAVHWGVALRTAGGSARDWDFVYSVCPSLAAASAAVLPIQEGLSVLLPSFCAALVYDSVRFAGEPGVPRWYAKLRKPLTVAAVASTGVCLGVIWETGDTISVRNAAEKTRKKLGGVGGE